MNNFVDDFVGKQIKENAIKMMHVEIQAHINQGFDKEEIEACYIGSLNCQKKEEYIPLVMLWIGRIYDELMEGK